MKFEGFAVTHTADPQNTNQENYFLNGFCKEGSAEPDAAEDNITFEKRKLYAVADGSASEINGDEAAAVTMEVLKDFHNTDFNALHEICFDAVNEAVKGRIFQNNGKAARSGTAALYINKNKATVYNMGDNSVFLYSGSELKKLSETAPKSVEVETETVDGNGNPELKTVTKPNAHYFGTSAGDCRAVPFISKNFRVKSSDVFLLCSDGVTENVGEAELKAILSDKKLKYNDKTARIIDRAIENGADGDITALVVNCKRSLNYMFFRSRLFLVSLAFVVCAVIVGFLSDSLISNARSFIGHFSQEEQTENDKSETWVPMQTEENENTENNGAEQNAPVSDANANTEPQTQQPEPVQTENTPQQPAVQGKAGTAARNSGKTGKKATQQKPKTEQKKSSSPAENKQQSTGVQQASPAQPRETAENMPSQPKNEPAQSGPGTSGAAEQPQRVTPKESELPIDFNN